MSIINSAQFTCGRESLLKRIRDAKLPEQSKQFELHELEAAGLLNEFSRPQGMDDRSYRTLVLLAFQNKELKKDREKVSEKLAHYESHYVSPLWAQAFEEPCPVERMNFRRMAAEDQLKHQSRRNADMDRGQCSAGPYDKACHAPWRDRDDRLPDAMFMPVLWHKPMTVMGYRSATGLSRRTIQNMLRRLLAQPINIRVRRSVPSQYSPETNAMILCEWLVKFVKDSHTRRAFVARTLALCKAKTPQELESLTKRLAPVFHSLAIHSEEQVREFNSYVDQCQRYPEEAHNPFVRMGKEQKL